MPDREKVIKGLEILINGCAYIDCDDCCFYISTKPTRCGLREEQIQEDALALLKEQETTSTGKTRIFQCEKCGYGIDDIYLSNEHDFDVYPLYCPNCGRSVKWE